ncbi:MAG: hypothetical protein JWO85_3598 [Candidatus Eremiobacteraeota bacterium]|jgi:hypothetical protein|nr:hypothetical protein [Candidatus Eremiobacteraeota bacterium]
MHHRLAALVAALTVLACAEAASAQTAPPSPSAVSQAAPLVSPPPRPRAAAATHKTVIDLIPTLSSSIGGDEFSPVQPASNPFVRSDVRLSYRLTQDLAPHLSFSYFHNAAIADNTLGRVVSRAGTFLYPQSARDALDDFGFSYALKRGYARLGYNYEHRVCCPAANDPTNLAPAAWHAVYAEGQIRTAPIGRQQLTFSFTERASRADHHVTEAYLLALPPGFTDSNRAEYGLTQTLGATANVLPRTQAFATFTWGATYFFDNAPFPYLADTFDYGLQRPISRDVTLRAEINQQTAREMGYPFPAPNALHRTKFVLSADIRIAP